MGGSSKKVTVGYKYYLGMHMVICHGPIDELLSIKVDNRLAWADGTDGGEITIDNEGLFGGEDREGGISGDIDILMGGSTQTKNSYLQSRLGTNIPAFRGVVSAVLKQVYLGLNPYLKPWSFRGRRVYLRSGEIEQWFPSVAGIISDYSKTLLISEDFSAGTSGYSLESGSSGAFTSVGGALQIAGAQAASIDKISKSFTSAPWTHVKLDYRPISYDNEDCGVFRLEESDGTLILNFTGIRDATVDSSQRAHLSYLSNQTGVILSDDTLELGIWYTLEVFYNRNNDRISAILYKRDTGETVGSSVGDSLFSYASAGKIAFAAENLHDDGGVSQWDNVSVFSSRQIDMNPAHIIRECLTDTVWGMGYLDADIDDTSFETAANTLFIEGMGISLLWDRQIPIEDFVSEIIRHINATLYVDRITGLFTLKLIRNDYDIDSLITLDQSNISNVSDYNRVDPGDAVNSVSIVYWDSDKGENASVTVDDVAMIQAYGAVINTTVQYPGFTNPQLAIRAAERDLQTLSSPLLNCTIEANREASSLNIGDVFKFEWPDYHDGYILMRVHQVSLGDGKKNRVKITCTEDVFSLSTTPIISDDEGAWEEPGGEPLAPPVQLAIEAPYYELVQRLGQTTLDTQLSQTPEIGYLLATATRPENGINASVWVDAGAGYEESAVLDFAPTAKLGADVDETETSWSLTDMEDLEVVEVGEHFQIGDELCRIDAIDTGAGTMTVGRAVLDTVPSTHSLGDDLIFWDVYAISDQTEYVDTEEIDVKVLTNSSQGRLELAAGVESTVIMDSRAIKPYPPGDVKLNTEHFPDAITGALSVSWVHRDRTQQTADTLIDFEDASIGPEAGTSYTLRFYDEDDTLITTATGETGLSYSYSTESDDFDTQVLAPTGIFESPEYDTIVLPTTNLQVHYTMSDITGTTIADETANGYDGTMSAGVVDNSGDGYITLDGNDNVDINESAVAQPSTYCWVITIRLDIVGSLDTFISTVGGYGATSLRIQNRGGGVVEFQIYNGSSFRTLVTTTALIPDTIYTIVAQHNGDDSEIWVNGVLEDSASGTWAIVYQGPESGRRLGWDYGTTSSRGMVGDILYYLEYADFLTPSEVADVTNYSQGIGGDLPQRLSGTLRMELESVVSSRPSYYKHDISVDRAGYCYNYGKYYGGIS